MDNISIHPLEGKDCEAVAALAKRNLPEKISDEMLLDVLKYAYNHFFVAYDEFLGRVVGFAGMMIIAEDAELLYIAVDNIYRKQGIGQYLLETVMQTARENQAYRILLEVRESNVSAVNIYDKNGFHKISLRKNYYSNPVENALIMEKCL